MPSAINTSNNVNPRSLPIRRISCDDTAFSVLAGLPDCLCSLKQRPYPIENFELRGRLNPLIAHADRSCNRLNDNGQNVVARIHQMHRRWINPSSGVEKQIGPTGFFFPLTRQDIDRKSTRLNSSHTVISYAVFCLKKKTFCQNKVSSASEEHHNGSPI